MRACVYSCHNATLLEITCRGSYVSSRSTPEQNFYHTLHKHMLSHSYVQPCDT